MQKIKKIFKIMFVTIFSVVVLLTVSVLIFIQQDMFGKLPSGERLERVKKSPNYKNGSFKNLSNTPDLTEGVSYFSILKEFLVDKKVRQKPIDEIPHQKHDLKSLNLKENILVWFGHSSYFMQIDGKRFLVDPVFSGAASPVKFTTKAFKGTDSYSVADFPEIDCLFISHDHWDHLDYETILMLKPKVKKVVCGLGTGEHFESWGYDKNLIFERDWNEKVNISEGFTVFTTPARHFSGRGLSRNKALWSSYILQTPSMKIYIGGDSGYDTHFAEIGKTFGPIDLAILENGQYDKSWKYIHMMPEEVLQAAKDLKAKKLFPVHSAKFVLANHPWDEPLTRISKLCETEKFPILTPLNGELVNLNDTIRVFPKWWERVK